MKNRNLHPKPTRADVALTVAGVTGVIAVFLPFAVFYPVMATMGSARIYFWEFGAFGVSFLLALPIFGVSAAWLRSGTLPLGVRIGCYVLAAACACIELYDAGTELILASVGWVDREFVTDSLVFGVLVAAGAVVLVRDLKGGAPRGFNAVMAMQVPYVVSLGVSLVRLWHMQRTYLNIGAYFVACACVVYCIQIVRALRPAEAAGDERGSPIVGQAG